MEKDSIILMGMSKCGNTWLRFLIYHYFACLIENRKRAITFQELNTEYQVNCIDENIHIPPLAGYPNIYRTHFIDRYSHLTIGIVRHPLDRIISYYHYRKGRGSLDTSFKQFIITHIPQTCLGVNSTIDNSDIVIKYEDLHNDALNELLKLCYFFNWSAHIKEATRAVQLSSFISLKKMSKQDKVSGLRGNHGSDFKGVFLRKGTCEQYKELPSEIIEMYNQYCVDNNLTGVYNGV